MIMAKKQTRKMYWNTLNLYIAPQPTTEDGIEHNNDQEHHSQASEQKTVRAQDKPHLYRYLMPLRLSKLCPKICWTDVACA